MNILMNLLVRQICKYLAEKKQLSFTNSAKEVDSDEELRAHRENIAKKFRNEPSEDLEFRPSKRTKRNMLNSSSDESDKSDDEGTNPIITPDKTKSQTSPLGKLDSYTEQIMKIFNSDERLYQKRYSIVREILSQACSDSAKNYKKLASHYQDLKENFEVNQRTLKQREEKLIEAVRHTKALNMEIEKQQKDIHNYTEVIRQQSISQEAFEMLKENHNFLKENNQVLQEDNKYLKQMIDDRCQEFQEKELIWSRELMNLKKTFEGQTFVSQSQTQSIRDAEVKTLQRNSPLLGTPEKVHKENVINESNSVGRNEYVTLHQPESVTSKHSEMVSR